MNLPRGYEVGVVRVSRCDEAQEHARLTSTHRQGDCCVIQDALFEDGVEVEGAATVSRWNSGKQVFPEPISSPNCLWDEELEADYLTELYRQDQDRE
jgi:hypothetical protein